MFSHPRCCRKLRGKLSKKGGLFEWFRLFCTCSGGGVIDRESIFPITTDFGPRGYQDSEHGSELRCNESRKSRDSISACFANRRICLNGRQSIKCRDDLYPSEWRGCK